MVVIIVVAILLRNYVATLRQVFDGLYQNSYVLVSRSSGPLLLQLHAFNCCAASASASAGVGEMSQKQKATASNVNCEYYLDLILFFVSLI